MTPDPEKATTTATVLADLAGDRPEPGHGRLDSLDSLRGLAALAVYCKHFIGGFGYLAALPAFVHTTPLAAYQDASAAIAMFFVLSGFVLSIGVLSRDAPSFDLRRNLAAFWLKRVARIWLPFVAILLVSVAAQHLLVPSLHADGTPSAPWLSELWSRPASAAQVARQAMLVVPTSGPRVLAQDWTLAIEMIFSLLMPFLLLVACESIAALAALTAVMVGLLQVHHAMVAFVIGMLLARSTPWLVRNAVHVPVVVRLAVAATGAVLYTYWYSRAMLPDLFHGPLSDGRLANINAVGAGLILAVVLASPALQAMLERPLLVATGRISYSIYLLHLPVLIVFAPMCSGWLREAGVRSADGVWILTWLATLSVVLALSRLSYAWIERPSIALGRSLAAAVAGRADAAFPRA